MTTRLRLLSGLLALSGFALLCLGATGAAAERQCTCRAPGQSYPVGACVCMARPGGAKQLACCGMSLNNTSWEFTGKACPVALTKPAAPARLTAFSVEDLDAAPTAALKRFSKSTPD